MIMAITAGSKLKQIRDLGMKAALEYEVKRGREPDDKMSRKKKLGYDIKSGERRIEVKGQEWKWEKLKSDYVRVTETELREATHLYVVCDVFSVPDVHVFDMSKIPFKAIKAEFHYRLLMAHVRDFELKE